MGERRVAIRIMGVASTTRGVAFAVTEGATRLIEWGTRDASGPEDIEAVITRIIRRARPLFIACEVARNAQKSERGRVFNRALLAACAEHRIMILVAERRPSTEGGPRPTNDDIAAEAAGLFPILADKLPKRRRSWHGVDDRIGVFLAVAAATAGWQHFRTGIGGGGTRPRLP